MMRVALPLLTLLCCAAFAELVKTPTQYLILTPKTPVTVDGKLNEWDMTSTPIVIDPADTKNPLIKPFIDPSCPIGGPKDISGRVALAWDDTYFYVAGQVTDDHLLGCKPDSQGNEGPAPWGCDSVMINMNSYRQPMTRNNPYSSDVTLGLRYAPMMPDSRGGLIPNTAVLNTKDMHWKVTRNSKWAVTESADGYNVEVAIPWSDLGYTPRIGERLFIAFMLPDMDPGQPLKQLGWGMSSGMKTYPIFRLSDRPEAVGEITISSDEVTTVVPWTARLTVDARIGQVDASTLRIRDAAGKVVLSRKLALSTPAGMTGITLQSFTAGEIGKPGNYTVEALLASPRAAVIARQPLRVTAPQPEPPVVQAPLGELHHMRPSRVAHNTFDLHARGLIKHGFVKSREDYLPFIQRYSLPGMAAIVRQQIETKSPWGYGYLLQTLAAYKVTGDDAWIKLGRDLMDYELSRGQVDGFRLMSYAAFRYYTWLKDPKSLWAPPDAEKRYRAMFYAFAAKPDNYQFSESGTHNRIWDRYCLQKVARQIAEEDGKPVDPRIVAYTDFHAKILEAMGDDDDASSGYNWGWFGYALAIYYHQGDLKPLVTNPGFVKVITRYRETIAPGGAMPTFGADSGWPSIGQAIWTFELMASITKDGRFRWTAHRVAEYLYNYLFNDVTQYHLPADNMKNQFLIGYFFADETVAPREPAGNSRLTWRRPMVPTPPELLNASPGMNTVMMVPQGWIPDKMVLSSGNDPRGLWGMVELLPMGGHGGSLPGNLVTLMQHDSVLLAGQGYYEQSPPYQNLLWIEDLDGVPAAPQPVTVALPLLADDGAFTYARVTTTSYQELPVTYTRDILFAKTGFVVVKDRAKFDATLKIRLGPCYQVRDLGPQCGDNWFNAYIEEMYFTGLGLGRGVQSFMNPPWDLLVYFSPRPERKHTVSDSYAENPYRQMPIRLRQSWAGMTRPGQEITFTSVLLPHAPMIAPKELLVPPAEAKDVPHIEIVCDDEQVTVLKVITETDPYNRIHMVHWVCLNNTGGAITAGPFETDAQVAFLRLNSDETRVEDRVMIGGKTLIFRNADEGAKARKLTLATPAVPEYLK